MDIGTQWPRSAHGGVRGAPCVGGVRVCVCVCVCVAGVGSHGASCGGSGRRSGAGREAEADDSYRRGLYCRRCLPPLPSTLRTGAQHGSIPCVPRLPPSSRHTRPPFLSTGTQVAPAPTRWRETERDAYLSRIRSGSSVLPCRRRACRGHPCSCGGLGKAW